MGVYTRFKKNPDGFRQIVELLESTPVSRRQKMIEVGMQEDPDYTERAMKYILTFEDILNLPDGELAEVVSKTPARLTAFAIAKLSDEIKAKVLKCCKPPIASEIKDYMGSTIGLREVGGAQLKMIECARALEKLGLVKTKRIPT